MLCLSRKQGERIRIGENIFVEVCKTGTVTIIGIEAPEEVSIVRDELLETAEQTNASGAGE